MPKTLIDMHLHSTYSDGQLTPKQIIKKLARAKISFAVLSDHDTVSGVKEFALEAKRVNIVTMPGVEISAEERGIGIHILGYGINTKDKRLLNIFQKQQAKRRRAFDKYVALFKKAGFIINRRKYIEFRKIKSVAKPHVFKLIWDVPQNQKLCYTKYNLKKTGFGPQQDFIQAFMDLPGQLAYANKKSITAKNAIASIRKAGGIAVWAHPGIEQEFKNKRIFNKIFKALLFDGIDGIEAFSSSRHPTKTRIKYLYQLTRQHKLIATVGSDDHDGTRIGSKISTLKVPSKYHKESVADLLAKIKFKKIKPR